MGMPVIQQGVKALSSEQLSSNSESIVYWCKQDLRDLTDIDVSGMLGADDFLKTLLEKNETLSSLVRINAKNTHISLKTLKLLRMIKVPYLVRDLPQYSSRFGCSVAVITVNIEDTELNQSEELDYSVIEQPAGPSYLTYYRSGLAPELAMVQVIVNR